jgi:hypothetical protein
MTDKDLESYAAFMNERLDKVTNRMIALPSAKVNNPVPVDKEKAKKFTALTRVISDRTSAGTVMMTLTYFPNRVGCPN